MPTKPTFRVEKDGSDCAIAWDIVDEGTGKVRRTVKTQLQREILAKSLVEALNSKEATEMTLFVLRMCFNRKFITDNLEELPKK